jgi:hypothetical protein
MRIRRTARAGFPFPPQIPKSRRPGDFAPTDHPPCPELHPTHGPGFPGRPVSTYCPQVTPGSAWFQMDCVARFGGIMAGGTGEGKVAPRQLALRVSIGARCCRKMLSGKNRPAPSNPWRAKPSSRRSPCEAHVGRPPRRPPLARHTSLPIALQRPKPPGGPGDKDRRKKRPVSPGARR